MAMTMNRELSGEDAPVTKREALNHLVRDKVQIAEARRRGLYPTDEEIDREYARVQEEWANMSVEDQQERERTIAEYLKGSGLSQAEYEEQDRKATGVETAFMRLRQNYEEELSGIDGAQTKPTYQAFVDGLVENAEIVILREDLLVD